MALWKKKDEAAAAACYIGYRDDAKIPKGYVPMVLVGDEEDGGEERILVHVRMLKEPCVAALLEMAAQQFGYGQRGVLRIPCATHRFKQMINMARKAN
ncbi:auxin-responsive protein SAUR71 [Brachypodium distachyon]|uniref:Auxin responsive protein n=1 Tax=Brachypodium distachyon TaxID=15368 RepID=A0A0Q3IER5_BRADI|nr:auxin-responsive protein SAUR71 [Brachypodium distachyon]KQK04443.1 hypothetical protein BRADI_2g13527v3 [Brachypodium distachyon]|eukprot:XP_003565783.1 auxin-responsive protein SAUR71 [Brachypodium distachyon]